MARPKRPKKCDASELVSIALADLTIDRMLAERRAQKLLRTLFSICIAVSAALMTQVLVRCQ